MEYIDKILKNDPSKTKWLTEEHGWHQINQVNMPNYQPSLPMQRNLTDCGLYLLENVEQFSEDPDFVIKNLR
jgi:Ulp1 family protease